MDITGPGIPEESFPPYDSTGLTSVLQEHEQSDQRINPAAIYYQDSEGNIQKLIRDFDDNKFAMLPPTAALILGTPLAAVNAAVHIERPWPVEVYGICIDPISGDTGIVEVYSAAITITGTFKEAKLAAITDNSSTRVFFQQEGKENEIAQITPGSLQPTTIVKNAIKGTNMGALETSLSLISPIIFDRCLVYHGQDSKLHFWWIEGESAQTEEIPVGSLLSNSAIAVARTDSKIIVYYQDENSEPHCIVKRENFGFNWGKPQKVESVDGTPFPPARQNTALTAIASEPGVGEKILLAYQGGDKKIHTVSVKIPAN